MVQRVFSTLLWISSALALYSGCNGGGYDSKPTTESVSEPLAASGPWDGESVRAHRDTLSHCTFPIPTSGYVLQTERGSENDPPQKFRHQLSIGDSTGVAVRVDIWDNPGRTDLDTWVREHLSHLIDAQVKVGSTLVGARKLPAVLLEQPRGPQAMGRRTAVFADGNRIARITCLDVSDARAVKLFERMVESIELEVLP